MDVGLNLKSVFLLVRAQYILRLCRLKTYAEYIDSINFFVTYSNKIVDLCLRRTFFVVFYNQVYINEYFFLKPFILRTN